MPETILTNALNSKILLILGGIGVFLVLSYLMDKLVVPRFRLTTRQAYYGMIFLALPFVYFLAIMLFPMVEAFQFSFQKYNILSPVKPYIGFNNYVSIVKNELFWKSLVNSLKFAAFRAPTVIVLSLITALALQAVTRYKNLLRTLMLLPFMTSGVALGWIFNFIYSRQGFIFFLLTALGVQDTKAMLLLNGSTALYAIAAVSAWASIGYYALLFSVGLDAIPNEVYDAAKVDGANRWQSFWKVTLPLLNPTIVLISILAVTASLKNFDLIRTMSGNNGTGGPFNSTLTMPLYIYMEAFTRLNMGRAAAITVVFFFIIMIITLIQLKVTQRHVEY